MHRRRFTLAAPALIAGVSAGLSAGLSADADESDKRRLTVGVIGHTGRGNYGHGLDTVWQRLATTDIVAVADADPQGLGKKLASLKMPETAGFRSYQEMLNRVRPDLVAVCPRHVDQHGDMIVAAIDAGVRGIYVEKPFVRTPKEADQVLSACARTGAKVAVAHRNRYHPVLKQIKNMMVEGRVGRVLELRGRGKGDRRGGGEDLWVLGSHVLNLMTFLGGEPRSCSATLLLDGREAQPEDVFEGAEGLGPLAGNEVHARFRLGDGIIATFDSIANDGTGGQGFGLQVIGSKATITIQADRQPVAWFRRGNPFQPDQGFGAPQMITTAGVGEKEPDPQGIHAVQHHDAAAQDLVQAVLQDRPPRCDAKQGAWTVEMVCGVFESHRRRGIEVQFPMKRRTHPLADWKTR